MNQRILLCVLIYFGILVSTAIGQPVLMQKVKQFQHLLARQREAGKDTSVAARLNQQSLQAAQRGNVAEAARLLDQAILSLSNQSGPPEKPSEERPRNSERQPPPDKSRPELPQPGNWATGANPVFVLPFSHHYSGPGGYYAEPSEIRQLAEFFHSRNIPGTLFFDGILVERLKKQDPSLINLINTYGLPLGYHGEETHGPYPVPSDLFAEVYPLREAQGYQGTWSLTTGQNWDTAVKLVTDRYSHALEHVIDAKTRMLDRRREIPGFLPQSGGLKLVQETFGRDVSIMPSHGLESAPAGFAFRKMSSFGFDQPAVPLALHALKIFKVSHVADQVMAIAGKDVSIFWYMGRLHSKGDEQGESSWTPKMLADLQRLDRSQPRLLLMGFSSFKEDGADETVKGLNEFFAANPGSGWVTGDTFAQKFEGEKEYSLTPAELGKIATCLANTDTARPPDLVPAGNRVFSLTDSFEALCRAFAEAGKSGQLPARIVMQPLYGPIAEDGSPLLHKTVTVTIAELSDAAGKVLKQMEQQEDRFIPARIFVAGATCNSAEFLLAMADCYEHLASGKKETVQIHPAQLFPPYADLLKEVFKPNKAQPLCYTLGQLWTVKPARIKADLLSAAGTANEQRDPGDPTKPANRTETGVFTTTSELSGPNLKSTGSVQFVVAANLDSNGGCYREDPSGADLYLATFDLETRKIHDFKRLTRDRDSAEWFPSMSPDGAWVAYDRTIMLGGKGRNRHEVRVVSLETGADHLLTTDARFPCFTPDGRGLVYSMQRRGSPSICIAAFQKDARGVPVLGEAKVVADHRHGADRVEDPSTFPDNRRIAFHRKADAKQGAGCAVINLDGSGFQEITPLAGAGHAAVNPDGKTVVFSISRNGILQIVQQTNAGWTRPQNLNLGNSPADFPCGDARLATLPTLAHTYTEWVAPDLLLVSSQGSDGAGHFSGSRVFLLQFSRFGGKPVIFDISGALQTLAGKKNRDFCTATGRLTGQ